MTTLAGLGLLGSGSVDGTGSAARFSHPKACREADATRNVYVADSTNHAIRKVTPAGVVTTLAGAAGRETGGADGTGVIARFHFPTGVTWSTAPETSILPMTQIILLD